MEEENNVNKMCLIPLDEFRKIADTEAYINEEVKKREDILRNQYQQKKSELFSEIESMRKRLSDEIRNKTLYKDEYIDEALKLRRVIDKQQQEIKELKWKVKMNETDSIAAILLLIYGIVVTIWLALK